jgi:hypothetical protein
MGSRCHDVVPCVGRRGADGLCGLAVGNMHEGRLDEMSPSGATILFRPAYISRYMKTPRNYNGVRELRNTWPTHSRSHTCTFDLSSTSSCCSNTLTLEQHCHQSPCSRRNTFDCWRNLRTVDAHHIADVNDLLRHVLNGATLLCR